jgi:ubiquinone/menaquinone biosynthesis C-methylase UbiE
MHEAVLRSAPIRPDDRILYVGCDSGAFTSEMVEQLARSRQLVAIDFSASPLARVERLIQQAKRKNLLFLQLRHDDIPFPDAYFDLVIAFGSRTRLPEPDRIIDEMGRVLKQDGRIYWHDVGPGRWKNFLHWLHSRLWWKRNDNSWTDVRTRMTRSFTIEFYRRWTHTWGKQSCLLVGRKTPD